jgi:hypothetical protein
MPVIDSIVLRNLDLRLPAYGARDRSARMEEVHDTLRSAFKDFLTTKTGPYLVKCFRHKYPDADVTEIKMLDLVLWQTRPSNKFRRTARSATGTRSRR